MNESATANYVFNDYTIDSTRQLQIHKFKIHPAPPKHGTANLQNTLEHHIAAKIVTIEIHHTHLVTIEIHHT